MKRQFIHASIASLVLLVLSFWLLGFKLETDGSRLLVVSRLDVSLAWLLAQGMTVIPSSTKRENLAANLAALKVRLSSDEMAAIATLDRGERCANPDFAPDWD
jgi:hypothetical protein